MRAGRQSHSCAPPRRRGPATTPRATTLVGGKPSPTTNVTKPGGPDRRTDSDPRQEAGRRLRGSRVVAAFGIEVGAGDTRSRRQTSCSLRSVGDDDDDLLADAHRAEVAADGGTTGTVPPARDRRTVRHGERKDCLRRRRRAVVPRAHRERHESAHLLITRSSRDGRGEIGARDSCRRRRAVVVQHRVVRGARDRRDIGQRSCRTRRDVDLNPHARAGCEGPSSHRTMILPVHVPEVEVADTNVAAVAILSVTRTPVAGEGPAFEDRQRVVERRADRGRVPGVDLLDRQVRAGHLRGRQRRCCWPALGSKCLARHAGGIRERARPRAA